MFTSAIITRLCIYLILPLRFLFLLDCHHLDWIDICFQTVLLKLNQYIYYVIFLQRTLWPTYYKRRALLWTKNMYLHVMYLRKMWNCTRAKKVTHSHTFCLQNGFCLCSTFTFYVDFIIIITKRAWNLARQKQISTKGLHYLFSLCRGVHA